MAEPMKAGLAGAVQLLSAAQSDILVYHAHPARHAQPAHRWLALEEPIGQHLERAATRCYRGHPVTNPSPRLSTYAVVNQSIVTSREGRPLVWYRDRIALLGMVQHACATGGGFPGAI
jgi:hypothetical protein